MEEVVASAAYPRPSYTEDTSGGTERRWVFLGMSGNITRSHGTSWKTRYSSDQTQQTLRRENWNTCVCVRNRMQMFMCIYVVCSYIKKCFIFVRKCAKNILGLGVAETSMTWNNAC